MTQLIPQTDAHTRGDDRTMATQQSYDPLPTSPRLTLAALPFPLDDLARDSVDPGHSFQVNAPCHLSLLLELCTGLAQAAQLAATQCEFDDSDHRAALLQILAVLAGYTKLAGALYTALAPQA